jgi:CIC family chloride channel protein
MHKGDLPFSVTFFKFWSALVTLSTFGNGGVVGPIGRVSAGIMSIISRSFQKIGFSEDDRRAAVICGMAAAISVIFHTPLGGGIFAVEITQQKKMVYKDFFPAILAGIVSVLFDKAMGWSAYYRIQGNGGPMRLYVIGWIVLLAFFTGIAAGAYTNLYSFIVKIFKRNQGNVLIKVLVGT